MIIDCAAYQHGRRVTGRVELDEISAWQDKPGAFVWLGLRMPTPGEAMRSPRSQHMTTPLSRRFSLPGH